MDSLKWVERALHSYMRVLLMENLHQADNMFTMLP